MASQRSGFAAVHGTLKVVAIGAGLLVTVVSLMAVVGRFTPNLWVRLGGALAVALAPPLLLVNRFVPDDPDIDTDGLPSDLLALVWLGLALVFVGPAHGATRGLLTTEGDRLAGAGLGAPSRFAFLLAGARPVAPPAQPHRITHEITTDAGALAEADASSDAGRAQSPSGGRRAERTPAELFRDLAPSVVTLTVQGRSGGNGGTGFLLDVNGTIATNHHVVDEAVSVRVKLYDGTEVNATELLADDPASDLALLRIATPSRLTPVVLGDSNRVVVGERAISIGNPLGLEHTLTDGLVSARRVWEGRPMIQMSVPVSPGNSGGPLFNMRGEVIGVTTAQLGMWARGQNLNLAVPVNVLKSMIRAEYPDRRRFGAGGNAPSRW